MLAATGSVIKKYKIKHLFIILTLDFISDVIVLSLQIFKNGNLK